jgi:hypothetical protein
MCAVAALRQSSWTSAASKLPPCAASQRRVPSKPTNTRRSSTRCCHSDRRSSCDGRFLDRALVDVMLDLRHVAAAAALEQGHGASLGGWTPNGLQQPCQPLKRCLYWGAVLAEAPLRCIEMSTAPKRCLRRFSYRLAPARLGPYPDRCSRAQHRSWSQKTPALSRARGFRLLRFTVLFGMGRRGSKLLWPPDRRRRSEDRVKPGSE